MTLLLSNLDRLPFHHRQRRSIEPHLQDNIIPQVRLSLPTFTLSIGRSCTTQGTTVILGYHMLAMHVATRPQRPLTNVYCSISCTQTCPLVRLISRCEATTGRTGTYARGMRFLWSVRTATYAWMASSATIPSLGHSQPKRSCRSPHW